MFDYRWANARRGGMTVLREVALPKPVNLQSQRYLVSLDNVWPYMNGSCFASNQVFHISVSVVSRLENHGLDPNVEIVPK